MKRKKQLHKDTKWAKQIITWQEPDGKWGCFHSLSQFYGAGMTTEQALGRLERLGYTIEDECIQKAVVYMNDCLTGRQEIPNRKEKVHDWRIFTSLMLATRIRRFTNDNIHANQVARQWADVITYAFENGTYDHEKYVAAYREILGLKPGGGRLIDFVNFYPISLLNDMLDRKTEEVFIDYVIHHENGIYYIYEGCISEVPELFMSRKASRYLAAIELLARYPNAKYQLSYVVDWLNQHKVNDQWDMGKEVNDKVYFPLSDNWRKIETRVADCTERIRGLIEQLTISTDIFIS